MDAYLFVRQLAAQYKHPIILDYKAKLNAIRFCLGITDKRFRKQLNVSLKTGLATIEGDHLRLHSNNADYQLKTIKKSDYHRTSNPRLFMQMVLLANHYRKQEACTKKKPDQTHLGLRISDSVTQGYSLTHINKDITASCAAISKLFKFNSTTTANRFLKKFEKRGLIFLNESTTRLTYDDFRINLKLGRKNIRYDKEAKSWYQINARTFSLNYDFRNPKPATPYDKLSNQAKVAYEEMGWTVEMINRHLA